MADPSREAALAELDPSPIEEDTLSQHPDSYFPNNDAEPPQPPKRSSTFGLNAHTPVWYLTRIQKYSSYTFSVFTAFHIANTSIIPLITRSVPASERYLLLTRPYYQSPVMEPFMIVLPLFAHIGSGVALRLYRRHQNLKWYGAESRKDRRKIAWPKISGTSKLGYLLVPLVAGHVFVNRVLPLIYTGGSSDIGLSFVSHGFAKHPAISFFGFAGLVVTGVWHSVWGWAKWLRWNPDQIAANSPNGELRRKQRWYAINAIALLVSGLWLAGGLGVVGKGGRVGGWLGREYDELLGRISLIGGWMASE